jgi:hypothetical protein
MHDCPDAVMRDRLPDLLHDRLPAAQRAEVRAHLETCADCRAELLILERSRAVMPMPAVDTGRIVAALPPHRAVTPWRRAAGSRLVRIAAVAVLVLGGATLLRDSRAPATPSSPQVPVAEISPPSAAPVVAAPSGATVQVAVRPVKAPTELAVGELFEDLTDSELQSLLDALGSLEALTPTETEVVVPALSRGGA